MLKEQGAKLVKIVNPDRELIKSETEGLLEGCKFDYQLSNGQDNFLEYQMKLDAMMKKFMAIGK